MLAQPCRTREGWVLGGVPARLSGDADLPRPPGHP
jgi:hypothetical protein